MWRRAVIALQSDYLGAGKITLEAQDVFHFGATPAIDRLIVVADHANVLVGPGQKPQPEILRDIGVLIFVDQHISEAPLVFFQNLRVILEDGDGFQQQIAKIGGVQGLQSPLIETVEIAAAAVGEALSVAFRNAGGRKAAVLPAVDHGGERARGPALLVDVLGRHHLLDQAKLIVGIEDGKIGLQPDELGMAAQDARADGMKSAEPLHAFDRAADQGPDAFLHLARGFVSEGDGQNLSRPGSMRGEDVGQARDEHARLAGSRPGQNQNRPIERQNRFALLPI